MRLIIFLILVCQSICHVSAQSRQTILDLGMPLVEITTVNGEEPTFRGITHPPGCNGKTITQVTKVPGRVKMTIGSEVVYDSGDYEEDLSGMKIRIRGNASAWDYIAKSYKIKLEKKADLLRRGDDEKYKDKNWLLLREVEMRNAIGFMVNSLMGIQWTPAHEYVNVFFNGNYLGVYMLVESVRRNTDCRLNVDQTGYVFEYDQYWWNEDVYVESSLGYEPLNYTFKYPKPEEITPEQLDYFKEMISKMEQSVNDGTYPEYIDMDSFARWILGRDILGGWDGTGSNYFLTKYDNTDNSKVMMANMWDLDGCFIKSDDWDAAHNHFVFKPLLDPTYKHSKAFIDAYTQLWDQISPTIFDTIINWLEDFRNSKEAEALSMAAYYDRTKYDKPVRNVDYFVEVAEKWFRNRKEWLAEAIDSLRISAATENEDFLKIERAGLPVLVIETVNGEKPVSEMAYKPDPSYLGNTIGKATKVPGRVYVRYQGKTVYNSHGYVKDSCGMTIKIRGNTSVISVKKPYKIKLQKKGDMLFRGDDSIYKDKNWLLIKDRKLKNRIGYKVNEVANLPWTPAFRYVNVIMNGKYEGLYSLVESVKRNNKCRLKMSDTGFIAEYDPYFWNEDVYVKSLLDRARDLPMHYTFKFPESDEITKEQLSYFKEYFGQVEASILDGSYPDYIDVESFARWMLAHDILGNQDGAGANIYFTKYDDTPDSKLTMANLWDMDGIMMTKDAWDEVHRLGVFYYYYLFEKTKNQDFKRMYKYLWEKEKDEIFDKILSFLDEYPTSEEGVALDQSIALDNARWDDYNPGVEESVAKAKEWFTTRKEWMEKAVNDIVVGIETIPADDADPAPVFYNLQGQRLVTPPAKGIYIQKTNRNNSRVIYHHK